MKVTGGLNASRLLAALEDGLIREEKYQPNLKCLAGRKNSDEISFFHRNKMVALLLQLNRHCGFQPETYALAVNLLDRFLTIVKAQTKYLPCMSICCLFLAAKIVEEDEAIPTAGDLIAVSRLKCTASDLLRMERIILDKLGWNLNAITPLYFLQVFHALCVSKGYLNNCPVTQHLDQITLRLEELLCHHSFTFVDSSTLALAVLSDEMSLLTDTWADATIYLQELAKISESELNNTRLHLSQYTRSIIITNHNIKIVDSDNNTTLQKKQDHTDCTKTIQIHHTVSEVTSYVVPA